MEPNSLQLEFDVVKGLKVDENWISSDRRKGNKEWSYAEAVKSRGENKVEENLFTINDKWVSNERNRRKCKRSNIEKMKLMVLVYQSMEMKKVVWLKIMLVILIL